MGEARAASRWRRWTPLIAGWSTVLGLVVFAVLRVDWSTASALRLHWRWLFVAITLQVVYQLAYVWLWYRVTLAHDVGVPLGRTLSLWSLSLAGKYTPLPGGMFALRTWVYRSYAQARFTNIALSCYEEGWLSCYSGVIVVMAIAAIRGIPWLQVRWTLIVAAVLLCVVPIAFPRAASHMMRRVFQRRRLTVMSDLPEPLDARHLAALLAGYCAAWLILGAVLTALARAVEGTQHLPWSAATASYAGAGILGMAAVFVPSGLGVRDAALTAALAAWIDVGAASYLSVAARALALVSESIAIISGWAFESRMIRRRASAES